MATTILTESTAFDNKKIVCYTGCEQTTKVECNTQVKNIGILAHVDAGKTTLTEQLLYLSGEVRSAGKVDEGTAVTDWLGIERSRGISVKSSSAVLHVGEGKINLIDTPGHVDFIGEVERCLSILDGVILVLSAVEGIQAQTEVLWETLRRMKMPTVLFINKIDRMGCDIEGLLKELQERFSDRILCFSKAEGVGTRDCRVSLCSEKDTSFFDELQLIAAETDQDAQEQFERGTLGYPQALDAFLRQAKQGNAFPVYLGAASLGVGCGHLLAAVNAGIPSSSVNREGKPSGIVYKIEHDAVMGKACYVRMFSGELKNRDSVLLRGREVPEKVSQIRTVTGKKALDSGRVVSGDIAAVYGLSQGRVGDVFGNPPEIVQSHLAQPLFRVQAVPKNPEELSQLHRALEELAEEDPLLGLEWVNEEQELNVKITGMIQLEVLSALLQERYHLSAGFSTPTVIYQETPLKAGYGFEAYTMPKPCWAVVKFWIEPGPRGSGLVYRSEVSENDILRRYQNHIEASVPETLKQGLYGWEVTDLSVTLVEGEYHVFHTHPLDFFVATPMALMDGLQRCGTTLLEPMLRMRISSGEEILGKVIGDLLEMRGEFDNPVIHGSQFTLEATVPVATSMEFPVRLGILSSGKAVVSSRFDGYRPCPLELGETAKRRGVNPLDRSKWILQARGAL